MDERFKRASQFDDKCAEFEDTENQAFQVSSRQLATYAEVKSEIWCLREEYQFTSKAFRTRSSEIEPGFQSTVVEEDSTEQTKTSPKASRARRPGIMHRKTDPFPMREFSSNYNYCKEIPVIKEDTTFCEETEDNGEPSNFQKNTAQDERFLVSTYDLAKRRLSLPVSPVEHSWNEALRSSSQELEDNEATSLNNPQKTCHRTPIKAGDMERRRRQSAYTRRVSTYSNPQDEIGRCLGKRRMSELPALSSLATRRRNAPHTLSVPVGLRRRGSRPVIVSEYQTSQRASVRAKNEMLATLSMSSWLNEAGHIPEIGRRRSFHNGFGVLALKKKEEKRLMVAHEILQTEKNYIKALETLNEVFIEPFQNASLIPEKDMRVIFPKQLDAIKNGHVRFMEELDERLNNFKWQGVLGDILAKLCNSYHVDFMTEYAEYVGNFPKAVAMINKYSRHSQKFRKFIEKCTVDPRCERLNLSAFLLTPIQRLPRYVLLLRQLSKYTDPNHPDSFHIEISMEKMIAIINLLNSSIQNSTRVARNSSRNQPRRRRKKHIFKAKDILHSPEPPSPRKSSDESENSEFSGRSTPCTKNLTLELPTPEQQTKSSDYGSLSETTSEATSPCQSSGSSKNSILKVILRNSTEARKNRRPLSTTEVEIFRRKDEHLSDSIHKEDELKRSTSRDGFGSIIRHKFGSFRRKHRSSDENLSRNLSLERLQNDECKITLYKRSHERLQEEENTPLNTSPSHNRFSLKRNKKPSSPSSGSSAESFDEARGLISPPSEQVSPLCDIRPPSREQFSPLSEPSSPLCERFSRSREIRSPSREHLSPSCGHTDSDDDSTCTSPSHSRPSSRYGNDSSLVETSGDNCVERRTYSETEVAHRDNEGQKKRGRKKLTKRNSITDVVKQFFVSKSRSHSPELLNYPRSPSGKRKFFNSKSSKEKITTV